MGYVILVDSRPVGGSAEILGDPENGFREFRTEAEALKRVGHLIAPEEQLVLLDLDRLPWRSLAVLELTLSAGSRIPRLVEEDLRPSGVGLPPRMEGP